MFLHDSFYLPLRSSLATNFPGAALFSIQDDGAASWAAVRAAMMQAERIVINSVERGFVNRFVDGMLSWNGPLGQAIIARNMAAAARLCRFADAAEMAVGQAPALVDFPHGEPDALPCLRADVAAAAPAVLVVRYAPLSAASDADLPSPNEIRLPVPPASVTLILPAAAKGSRVMLDVGGGAAAILRRVAVGSASADGVRGGR